MSVYATSERQYTATGEEVQVVYLRGGTWYSYLFTSD